MTWTIQPLCRPHTTAPRRATGLPTAIGTYCIWQAGQRLTKEPLQHGLGVRDDAMAMQTLVR